MLRALMEKADCMQDQLGTVSREMETLWKNQNEIVDTKTTTIEMKSNFHYW